jgi:hypothetical protein
MPKVTTKNKSPLDKDRVQITAKTGDRVKEAESSYYSWWLADNDHDLRNQVVSTANYLYKNQQYRIKQASVYTCVYSGKPLYNYALNSKLLDVSNRLPAARPTVNVTQSCIDTLVSRISQSRPKPVFLTDNGDYKERKLSKQMNAFIAGELYRTKAYDKVTDILRDAAILGDGLIKVVERNGRVELERTLETEVFVDRNDAHYGEPRGMIHLKLCDREVVEAMFEKKERKIIATAEKAYVDASGDSSETVVDQVILVEAWHLPSSNESKDGRHVIACSSGILLDEPWEKEYFPFVKLAYCKPVAGYWSQGLADMLSGTQIEINKLLATMSQAINLIGVPRIFLNQLSKVVETAFNNNIGTIIKYSGDKPEYEVAPCVPQEMYAHLERLINYAYQISGVSSLSAAAQKPSGLDSGEAIRSYDDLQTDRFASLAKRYEQVYIDLAYQIIDLAKDIAERDGSYSTVYPNKDGTREVDLPKAAKLKDTYVIQCFDQSALPKDPAGRQAKLSEMLASNEITIQEFRRLSGFPDLEQSDKLANALEERILQILDLIVEEGDYTAPDPFLLDPTDLATTLCVNYINLYAGAKLEESRMELLRDFFTNVQVLKQQATAPPPMAPGAPLPQAGAPDQANNPNAAPPPVAPPAPMSAVSSHT